MGRIKKYTNENRRTLTAEFKSYIIHFYDEHKEMSETELINYFGISYSQLENVLADAEEKQMKKTIDKGLAYLLCMQEIASFQKDLLKKLNESVDDVHSIDVSQAIGSKKAGRSADGKMLKIVNTREFYVQMLYACSAEVLRFERLVQENLKFKQQNMVSCFLNTFTRNEATNLYKKSFYVSLSTAKRVLNDTAIAIANCPQFNADNPPNVKRLESEIKRLLEEQSN